MKKRIVSILCALALIVTAIPLSVSAATTTKGTTSKLVATNIPKSFPYIKQDPSYTVVAFWHAMSSFRGILVSNIASWYNATEGKKKKIYVQTIYQGGYGDISLKIAATLQSGAIKSLPDLMQTSAEGVYAIEDSKYIVFMEDMMNADKTFTLKSKLSKCQTYMCNYKGKQLGMPFATSVSVLHYNIDAFKAVGLDPNKPPKTFAEFADAAKKLVIKGTGKKPVRYGATVKISASHLSTWIARQKGGKGMQFDNDNGRSGHVTKYVCGSEGTLKATLTEWKKVLDTGAIDYNTASGTTNYQTGMTAMCMESSVIYDTVTSYFQTIPSKDKATKLFERGMTEMPSVNESDARGQHTSGSAIYMFDKGDAKKKNATWQFVKFLCSVDVSAYWFVNSGYFPVNSDAVNTKYVQDELKAQPPKVDLMAILADTAANHYTYQTPIIPSYGVYNTLVGDKTSLMAQGKLTVDQTVEAITKKTNALLDMYNKANG